MTEWVLPALIVAGIGIGFRNSRVKSIKTSGVIRRSYKSQLLLEADADRMVKAGWQIVGDTAERGKVAVGRTSAKAVVFLPWAFMRPARKRTAYTVTYLKPAPAAVTG